MADEARLLKGISDLTEVFRRAEKPAEAFGIGVETEKFGVDAERGTALHYSGASAPGLPSMGEILEELGQGGGWAAESEYPGAPLIALRRGGAAITLEPGSQLELSGDIQTTIHGVLSELREHLAELAPLSKKHGLAWLSVGFHPLAAQADLDWVPKQRYVIMREYLPTKGSGAHDMMRRTGTTQANFDFSDEQDAMQKLRVLLALGPLIHAMTANSPFVEGRIYGGKSQRGDVWTRMDPSRSGLIPTLWGREDAGYADYAEWALDAGMFLFKRDGKVVTNTGQTFRDFMQDGYEGHRATFGDWVLHLNTLFPEARLKSTLEFRSCDALPVDLAVASVALVTGLLYDQTALEESTAFIRGFRYDEVQALRPALVREGLTGSIAGRSVRALAERLLAISEGGLARRALRNADGDDESTLLKPLAELVLAGRVPADLLLSQVAANPGSPKALIESTRVL